MTDAPGTPAELPAAVVVLGAMFAFRYPYLLAAAAGRGLVVLAVDSPTRFSRLIDGARRSDPGHPLAGYADLAWIEGDQHEQVIEQVLVWSRDHRIRGVLALEESFVEVVGVLADLLDLPSPGLRATRVCRNKQLQRRYLPRWSPPSLLIRAGSAPDSALDRTSFPAVVKPVGREASSGVRRVEDRAALTEALAGYQPGEDLLVEELVAGHEISVESLVQGGRTMFASITGKVTTEAASAYFVELGHTVPDPDLDAGQRRAVLDANAAVLRRLEFADGIAHAEYRVRADGTVALMEIAARTPGDNIGVLYHLACGVPLESALLAIAVGEPASYPEPVRWARGVYHEHGQGVLRDVRAAGAGVPVTWLSERWAWPDVPPASGPDAPGQVRMIVVGRDPGYRLTPIRQSADRVVMSVLDAPAAADLDEVQARCARAIRIVADPPEPAAVPVAGLPDRLAAPVPAVGAGS
jgi:biotin carboxylase